MSELTVTAVLRANVDNFTKGLSAAKAALGELTNSNKSGGMTSIAKSMFGAQLAAQGVSKVIGMVSSGMGSMVGELNDSSKAWQTFEGNMKMLGKSSGEIDSTRKSLQDFAGKTIYSASDMASTFSQMAAIGYEDSEKLVKGMGGIAAAAENPQQAMKSMSQQMTQALSKPTMQWQDFRIMLEQAPAGMSAVAKEMGMTMDEMVLAIQNGEISSKDFADALATVGTSDTFTRMATEFKTVDQAIDGLREGLANKLQPAFNTLSKIGINAIKGLANYLDTVNFDGLKDKIMQVRFAIVSFFKGFSKTGAMDSFKGALNSVKDAIKNVISAFTGASPKAVDLGKSFGNMAKGIADAVKGIADFIANLQPGTIQKTAMAIAGLFGMFKLAKVVKKGYDAFKMFKKNPMDAFMKSSGKGGSIIRNIFSGIADVIKGAGTAISTVFQGLGKGIGTIIESFGKMSVAANPVNLLAFGAAILLIGVAIALIATQAEGVATILKALGDAIASIFVGIGTGIGIIIESIGTAIGTIITAATPLVDVIGARFNELASIVADAIVRVTQAIAPFIPDITRMVSVVVSNIPRIISSFGEFAESVGKAISEIITSVSGLLGQIGPILTSAGQMFRDLGTGVKTAFEGVQGAIREFGTLIQTTFNSAGEFVKTFGETIEGVLGKVDEIIATIGETAIKMGTSFDTFADALIKIGDADLNLMGMAGGFTSLAGGIALMASSGIEKVSTGIQGISQGLATTFRVSALADDFTALGEAFSTFPDISTLSMNLGTLGENIGKIFGISALAGDFTALGTALGTIFRVSALATDFGALKSAFEGFPTITTVATGLTEIGTALGTIFRVSALATDFTALKESLTGFDAFGEAFNSVGEAVTALEANMTQFSSSMKQAMTACVQAVTSGTSQMNVAFRSGLNQMVTTAQAIKSRLVNIFSQLRSEMFTAGVNAGQGFNQGLASQRGAIESTARGIATSVSSTIQNALKIHSPSRLLAWMGQMVGLGLVKGISSMISSVSQVSDALAMAAVPSIPMNTLSGNMGGTFTHELTDTSQTSMMADLISAVEKGQVVTLNTGAIIGGTADGMDMALGQSGNLGSRWNIT